MLAQIPFNSITPLHIFMVLSSQHDRKKNKVKRQRLYSGHKQGIKFSRRRTKIPCKISRENVTYSITQETKIKLNIKSNLWEKKRRENVKSGRLEHKAGYPVDLSFGFELYQKCQTLLKYRDLLACVIFYETTWVS